MSGGNGFVNILTFTSPPRRVVSLVPSMTESLFELGLGAALVGVTDYCRPPGDAGRRLPRVGGTRDPDIEAVGQLNPDLVLANQEENRREAVQALEALGLKVWVTFPRSVQQAMDVLWAVLRLFGVPGENPKIRTLEMTLEWTQRAAQARQGVRVFCPIWHGRSGDGEPWWMTFAEEIEDGAIRWKPTWDRPSRSRQVSATPGTHAWAWRKSSPGSPSWCCYPMSPERSPTRMRLA
jgi:hypothetical protein